ncbi:hypothetical protein DRO26_01370 [Candidatus Bathyarchaeota archaeon]|nr:MAG: hypothetical protein DRO26_01370 [Candidatus Bathyarchaeota archaeon]
MNMDELEEKYRRYADNLKHAFSRLTLKQDSDKNKKVEEVVDLAKRYFMDAEYFREKNQVVTALISLAYCEGLLDALRILNYVNFQWRVK